MKLATPTIGIAALLASALLVGSAPAGLSAAAVSTCTPPPAAPDPALPAPRPAVVSYPVPSSTAVSKNAATLLATVDTGGVAGQVAFELGDATAGLRCTAVQQLAAVTGPQPVTAKLRSEKPGTTVHFRLVVTTAAGQVVGADQAFTTVANATRLAPGTTMLGIRVGYLTPAQARARVLARFARPVVFTWHGKRWKATPKQLGATADVDGALDRALAGVGGGRTVPVTITVDPAKVESYVDYLDSLYARSAQVGSVTRVGRKAKLVEPLTARAVQKQRMETIITRTLKSATRPPIELLADRDEARRAGTAVHRRPARGAVADALQGRRRRPPHARHDRAACAADAGRELRHRLAAQPVHVHLAVAGGQSVLLPACARHLGDVLLRQRLPPRLVRAGRGLRQGLQLRAVREPRLRARPRGVMQVLYTTVPDHTPLIVVDA